MVLLGSFSTTFLVAAVIAVTRVDTFTIYPSVDAAAFASALNVTTACLSTLNTTLPGCDPTLLSMIGWGVDNFWWEDDNVTALCNQDCISQTYSWDSNVAADCEDQTLSVGGKLVPVDTLTGRYKDGLNIACLSSTEDAWCLTQSQSWIGSDIVRPDCAVTPSDPQCTDTTDVQSGNDRLANLYSDDVLCNSCFVQLLIARVSSPFLPDTDHSDYLVEQLQDIADVCSTSIADITTRPLFAYDIAPYPTSQAFGDRAKSSSTTTASVSTCTGQSVAAPGTKRDVSPALRHGHLEATEEKRQSSHCDALSTKYGIATGDLQALTDSDTCTLSDVMCVPAACALKEVTDTASCDTLASDASITTQQLLLWNPNIIGLCDGIQSNQYICIGAPGGTYSLAPPPLGIEADAANQQRGGTGSNATPTSTAAATSTSNLASRPKPTFIPAQIVMVIVGVVLVESV